MTSAQVETVFNACIPIARAFFQLDPAWKVIVRSNPDIGGAQIMIRNGYRDATLEHGLGLETAEQAWEFAAHEVAHIALAELLVFKAHVTAHLEEDKLPATLELAFTLAMESMVQRLADIFVSACPCPFVSNVIKLSSSP